MMRALACVVSHGRRDSARVLLNHRLGPERASMRSALGVVVVAALATSCLCPGPMTDAGPIDAGATDASVADSGSEDGGRVDGGLLLVGLGCLSQTGPSRFATRLFSFRYNLCAEFLFRGDAGATIPGVQGPPGYGLVDARYGLCTGERFLRDGGLDQSAPRVDTVAGKFEWRGEVVPGVPVIFAVVDGSATFAGADFTIESEPKSIDFFCPGE